MFESHQLSKSIKNKNPEILGPILGINCPCAKTLRSSIGQNKNEDLHALISRIGDNTQNEK